MDGQVGIHWLLMGRHASYETMQLLVAQAVHDMLQRSGLRGKDLNRDTTARPS